MMALGKRIAAARKKLCLTQAEIAEKLGVSFQAVSQWERGETTPDIDKLPELAQLLRVTTDWLLMGREEDALVLDIQESLSDRLYSEDRMYTYIKTYATVRGMMQTLRALLFAKEMHKGQFRRGKDHVPYIYHPLLVACHALALGLDDDDLIAAALLHDVCEDCAVKPEELPVGETAREAVRRLTRIRTPGLSWDEIEEQYYDGIAGDPIAALVKLMDRCCNVSAMATAFSREKMVHYIQGTEKWVYPLIAKIRGLYPQYANQVFLIKYHLLSVVETIKHQL